jgi:hypothetical protein
MSHHLVEFPELVGRRIQRFMFSNNLEWRCITIEFTDETVFSLKLEIEMNAEVELCVRRNGDLTDFILLDGVPVRPTLSK